jgi:single-strand DNA-binding protein
MATSRSLNKAMLIGNLSRNPVIKTTPNGATVCTFGVATNTAWKDESGELQERAEFHNVVSWNKLAEICAQILAVGMLVFIDGEMRTRSWDDENGIRHYRSEVRINDMKLLDSKGKSGIGVEEARASGESSRTKTLSKGKSDEKKDDKKEEKVDKKEESPSKDKKEELAPEDLPF